ncbi:MAG: sorbosone dehydrogenase family protein [Haloarculaceae archaeon]
MLGLGGCQSLRPGTETEGTVGAELIADGFTAPVGIAVPPGDDAHRFVVDQPGRVHVVGPDGRRSTPFLDVTDLLVALSGYEERGLLGLAFHPDFQRNRRVFVRYSAPLRSGMPAGYDHTFVLSEFRAPDGIRADPASERRLLELPEPQANHNAGDLAFGPGGYLYVGVGDGGGADDADAGHVDDWYDRNAGGNGQDVTANLLGSVLRLDVDQSGGDQPYGIPEDNPLVGRPGRDELYAWGFRNPWRFSFSGGDLYVADVGQNRYEEVDRVEKGGNYGWNVREGTHCFSTASPSDPPANCPSETADGQQLRDPIVEYSHRGDGPTGVAVIGGYRYQAGTVGPLTDRYVFGDWQADGTLLAAREPDGTGLWPIERVGVAPTDGSELGQYLLAFGRDRDGELTVATTDEGRPTGSTGRVHRLVPAAGG